MSDIFQISEAALPTIDMKTRVMGNETEMVPSRGIARVTPESRRRKDLKTLVGYTVLRLPYIVKILHSYRVGAHTEGTSAFCTAVCGMHTQRIPPVG